MGAKRNLLVERARGRFVAFIDDDDDISDDYVPKLCEVIRRRRDIDRIGIKGVVTLASLIRSNFYGRAIPWTTLMLEKRVYNNDMNTRITNVLSVPVSALLLASPLAVRFHWIGIVSLLLIVLLIVLNGRFLAFLVNQRGARFALGALPMTWLTYLYSGLGLLVAGVTF